MRVWYLSMLSVMGCLLAAGMVAMIVLAPPEYLADEQREPAGFPKLTTAGWFDGSFTEGFDEWFSDAFPERETWLDLGRNMGHFYYFSAFDTVPVILPNGGGNMDLGGNMFHPDMLEPDPPSDLDDVESPIVGGADAPSEPSQPPGTGAPSSPPTESSPPESPPIGVSPPEGSPSDDPPSGDQDPDEPSPDQDPEPPPDEPAKGGDGTLVNTGAILIDTVQARAMEFVGRADGTKYANALSNIAAALPGKRVFSLVTPNSIEFYGPQSSHFQRDMISQTYGKMSGVLTVDAYSALAGHIDEYIFFRTDHHWTQLGAYYAYTAFCQTAGFEAVPLDRFETGRYESFVGTFYGWTKAYPASKVLANNPDYLDYYLPIVPTSKVYYKNYEMKNGVSTQVVSANLRKSVGNKYLCFGGDTPLSIIDSQAGTGRSIIVFKESYGNAFVPFLTSHYDKIFVVDAREINRNGKPSFNLPQFMETHGIDEVLVINYPYCIGSKVYSSVYDKLVR